MNTASCTRGEVVISLWPNKRTADLKPRPAIIIQSDHYIADDGVVILVPLSSDLALPLLECRIPVLKGTAEHNAMGITRDSLILPDKVFHIDARLIGQPVGTCPDSVLQLVERGLEFVLGL